MTIRVDLLNDPDEARSRFLVDGVQPAEPFGFEWTDQVGQPFAAIYVDRVRQYDVEVWTDGDLRHRVPPHSDLVDEVYAAIEARAANPHRVETASQPPPDEEEAAFSSRLEVLRREIAANSGQICEFRWKGLRRSLDVHNRNSSELGGLIDAVGSSSEVGVEMFQNVRTPTVRLEVQARLDQRLHNYVASTASLIDHTRRVMSKYPDSHFLGEYERRRSTISDSPSARFIRDLRNYTTHRELPFVGHTVSIGMNGEPTTTRFELSVQVLSQWDKWSSPARALLDRAGETVGLREVLHEHVTLLRDLYDWIFRQIKVLHRYEFCLLEELRLEHDWILSAGAEGRPRRFGRSNHAAH